MPTPSRSDAHVHHLDGAPSAPQSPVRPSHHGFASCPDDASPAHDNGNSGDSGWRTAPRVAAYEEEHLDDDTLAIDGPSPSPPRHSATVAAAGTLVDGASHLPSTSTTTTITTTTIPDNLPVDGPKAMDIDGPLAPVNNGSPSAASTTTLADDGRTARPTSTATVGDDRRSSALSRSGRRGRGAGSLSPVSGVGDGEGSRIDVDWEHSLAQRPRSGVYEYSSLRVIPTTPSSYLRPGSRFHGTQQSERQVYDVQVEIKHVDLRESFLCGFLRIQGLTEDHPTLTTYFEGEIIGTKYGFITKHESWGATDKIDLSHWAKFTAFRAYQKQARKGPVHIRDVAQKEHIFMRWKEHFLVPDHRVKTISGASFEGFYYICFNQIRGEVSGIYFHAKSEKFQQLELKHVEDRGCFSAMEFR